jgi:tryptophan halogenase
MIRNILVLGGGSAGFLAAITLKHRLPQLPVTVLRSKEIGIIGVGEGTTIPVMNHLHGYLGIGFADMHRVAQPTWKMGIRFLWGPRPYFDYALSRQLDVRFQGMSKVIGYYSGAVLDYGAASALMTHNCVYPRRSDGLPHITSDPAYHIENELFVAFLEKAAQQRGVDVLDDTVTEVRQNEAGITALELESGRALTADLYIDCSGFRSVLLGQALAEPFVSFKRSLFVDRAVVGGWQRDDEPIKPYTTAETMDSGWCWQIEHEFRINRGYVYSSDFVSDADAEQEFRAKNPKVTSTRIVKFVTGRHEQAWVKNVVAMGNSSGFVEPLESTSLGAICFDCHALAESLADADLEVRPTQVGQYNKRSAYLWDMIRDFLAIHYKFNTRLTTPFWRACVQDTDLCGAEEFVAFYRENGPSTLWRNQLLDARNPFGFDGYLSMMIGMNIPYRKTFQPTEQEQRVWDQLYQRMQTVASQGVTVKEALGVVRAPWWQWPPNPYGNQ